MCGSFFRAQKVELPHKSDLTYAAAPFSTASKRGFYFAVPVLEEVLETCPALLDLVVRIAFDLTTVEVEE